MKKYLTIDIIGIIVGIIGVIVSTFGVYISLNLEQSKYLISGLVIINISFIVITSISIVIVKFKSENFKNQLNATINTLTDNLKQKDEEINQIKSDNDKKIKNCLELSSERTIHYDSLIDTLNTFSTKVYTTEKNHNNTYLKIQNEFSDKEHREDKIFSLKEQTYNNLIDYTKRFLRLVLDETKGNIEKYLKLKGYDVKISLAVKQVNKIVTPSDTNYRNMYAYTVFRDYDTYKNQEDREILGKKYAIYKNSDFADIIHSEKLKDSIYINNNLQDKRKQYKNENQTFLNYYDCTIVVPIGNYETAEGRILFGFLACDTKKFDKYGEIELFDNVCSKIILTSARAISTYYSYIYKYSECWEKVLYDYNKDFLEKIFNKDLKCS